MMEILSVMLAGFFGGFMRSSVGMLKYYTYFGKKRFRFRTKYLAATLAASGMMGLIAGLFVENDPRFALLAGYAGTDFVEGLYKVHFRKRYGR